MATLTYPLSSLDSFFTHFISFLHFFFQLRIFFHLAKKLFYEKIFRQILESSLFLVHFPTYFCSQLHLILCVTRPAPWWSVLSTPFFLFFVLSYNTVCIVEMVGVSFWWNKLIRIADNTWLKSICLDAVGYFFSNCLFFLFLRALSLSPPPSTDTHTGTAGE